MKKLYIRADGNEILGLGHLMRCMSIASAYVEAGGACEFIVADGTAAQIVREKGFKATSLNSKWDDLNYEVEILLKYIKDFNVELLLVDSYYATEVYFNKLYDFTTLLYLTGKCDKAYRVHALINYNIGSERVEYDNLYQNTGTKLFIGVQYAPLRKQFENASTFSGEVKNILLTTGGTDGNGFPVALLEEIENLAPELLQWNWHIVVGKFYIKEVQEKLVYYSEQNQNICLYENVIEMAELMQKCDLAVSSAGSTVYELCACGVPTIAFSFVDNQVKGLEEFAKNGYVFSVGDVRDDMKQSIHLTIQYLQELKMDDDLREVQSKKMREFIDGRGAKRLAEMLQTL